VSLPGTVRVKVEGGVERVCVDCGAAFGVVRVRPVGADSRVAGVLGGRVTISASRVRVRGRVEVRRRVLG
jgi:hypothetical protein